MSRVGTLNDPRTWCSEDWFLFKLMNRRRWLLVPYRLVFRTECKFWIAESSFDLGSISSAMTATELLLNSYFYLTFIRRGSNVKVCEVGDEVGVDSKVFTCGCPESVEKRHGNQEQSTDFHNVWTDGGAKPTDLYEFLNRQWYLSNQFFCILNLRWCRTNRFYWFMRRQ